MPRVALRKVSIGCEPTSPCSNRNCSRDLMGMARSEVRSEVRSEATYRVTYRVTSRGTNVVRVFTLCEEPSDESR